MTILHSITAVGIQLTCHALRQTAARQVNDEHGLMRFEFIEAVVRLAISKYGKGIATLDVSEAVRKLIELNIIPRVKPQVGRVVGLHRKYCCLLGCFRLRSTSSPEQTAGVWDGGARYHAPSR